MLDVKHSIFFVIALFANLAHAVLEMDQKISQH
jgi:hypothetical protein